jgi:hypothetical protein
MGRKDLTGFRLLSLNLLMNLCSMCTGFRSELAGGRESGAVAKGEEPGSVLKDRESELPGRRDSVLGRQQVQRGASKDIGPASHAFAPVRTRSAERGDLDGLSTLLSGGLGVISASSE